MPAYAQGHGIELVDLQTLFREADFVSVNAPLAPETEKIVNRAHLALMKPSAFLINTARGGLVDEAALYEALAAGRIAGAGLDVFEVEPLPAGSPLRRLTNVLLTPHCAGGSIEAVVAMTESLRRQHPGDPGRPRSGRGSPEPRGAGRLRLGYALRACAPPSAAAYSAS